LLRSINLLQEELAALQEVNYQQVKLVTNYISVIDDMTYKADIPSRRAMFPYERLLLESCQEYLGMTAQEYRYLLARCGPLSDSTKQSLEITEEDHGKAIMVFTIVTVIFLPLSFVTSFLGMNTTDIRDMGSSSSLFWTIAIPLTAITMASVLYIGYNGDDLRDFFDMLYRIATGKQSRSTGARGISVAQRTLARKQNNGTNTSLDFSSIADEAEFADPRPEAYYRPARTEVPQYSQRPYTIEAPALQWEPYRTVDNQPAEQRTLESRFAHGPSARHAPEVVISDPIYRTSRSRRTQQAETYEPAVLQGSRPPPPVAKRSARPAAVYTHVRFDEDDEDLMGGPQYQWVKKGHRHHRSARHVQRPRGEDRRVEREEFYRR
jgi:hypothetical protein